jgi:hypothetical protein
MWRRVQDILQHTLYQCLDEVAQGTIQRNIRGSLLLLLIPQLDPPPAVKARDNRWREESAATRAWASRLVTFQTV